MTTCKTILLLITSLLLCTITNALQPAASLYGDWQAMLKVPGQELPLVIHLSKTSDGALGTLDSPKQNAYGIRMSEIIVSPDNVAFTLPELSARYKGKLDPETGAIVGLFSQRATIALNFSRLPQQKQQTQNQTTQSPVIGTWSGNIELPGNPLAFVLHISENGQGLIAHADSPTQQAFGLTVDTIHFENKQLKFDMSHLGAQFSGTLDASTQQIVGVFQQSGADFSLTLTQGNKPSSKLRRPQTPTPPYSYSSEDIRFENSVANIELAGTLTKPLNGKLKGTAVLISGSGPQDRDETVVGHKPFLVLADHLTQQGYAVFRFDDRGVGQSEGDFHAATSADFASDVSAAVSFLQTRDDLSAQPIGLIGHSEGAMIAPMVAAPRNDIAFLVLMAGPGMPISNFMAERDYLYAQAKGLADHELNMLRQLSQQHYQELAQLTQNQTLPKSIKGQLKQMFAHYVSAAEVDSSVEQAIQLYQSEWFRYFIKHNPQQVLAKLKIPVLAINGSKDIQVPADSNLRGIEQALRQAGNHKVTVQKLPQLNHLFQTSDTGFVEEYTTIEETLAPVALNTISDWLHDHIAR